MLNLSKGIKIKIYLKTFVLLYIYMKLLKFKECCIIQIITYIIICYCVHKFSNLGVHPKYYLQKYH